MSKPPRRPPTERGNVNSQIRRATLGARPKPADDSQPEPAAPAVRLGTRPRSPARQAFHPVDDDAPLSFDEPPSRPAAKPRSRSSAEPPARPPSPTPPKPIEATPEHPPPRPTLPTPGPYTVDHVSRDIATEQSRALVEVVTGSVVDRLAAESDRRGGRLTSDEIRALRGDLIDRADTLEPAFQRSFEDFGRVVEKVQANRMRTHHFERLMVKRIADLFHGDGAERMEDGQLSRRLLPGFLRGLDQMLGPGPAAEFRQRATVIVERVQSQTGARFDWDAVYTNLEARRLVARAQIRIVPFYKDLERRKDWQRNIINGNLAPFDPDAGHCENEREWEFRLLDFLPLTRHLFSGLDAALSDIQIRGPLSGELGETVLRTAALLARL